MLCLSPDTAPQTPADAPPVPCGMRRPPRFLAALLGLLAVCMRPALADDSVAASIVNGRNAPKNRYPWVVSLWVDDADSSWSFCMGVLIQESVVMTAASCVRDDITGINFPPAFYHPLVRIGGYYRLGDRPPAYQLRHVVRTLVNPGFVSGFVDENGDRDVALMLLSKPSTKTPIALPRYTHKPSMPLPAMSRLTAMGWGWTKPSVPSEAEALQQIDMSLLALRTCQRLWGTAVLVDSSTTPPTNHTIHSNFLTNSMLCSAAAATWPHPNGGPCWGDAGAPFIERGASAAQDIVYGMGSFGPTYCGRGTYVMADVAQLRPWIDAAVRSLTSDEWTGRVWGDPNVLGFDGSEFQTKSRPGTQLLIMKGGPMSLVAALARHPYLPKLTVMRHLTFKWHVRVVVGIKDTKTYVTVNGAALQQGGTVKVLGGSVRFREDLARWSQSITIEQPGMRIRVNRLWNRKKTRSKLEWWPWFDVWVLLTEQPRWQLSGVLGATLPEATAAAAGADGGGLDLAGGLVLPLAG